MKKITGTDLTIFQLFEVDHPPPHPQPISYPPPCHAWTILLAEFKTANFNAYSIVCKIDESLIP